MPISAAWARRCLLVFLAALKTYPVVGVAVVAGLVITAVYVMRVFTQAFFGPPNPRWQELTKVDLSGWQMFPRAILIALLVFFGFVPKVLLDMIDGATTAFLGKF